MAEDHLKLARRHNMGLIILYADIDNLKKINDTLGHEMGDSVIFDTANIIKSCFRESDIVARMSGDEFAVISLEPSKDNVEIIIQRFREAIDVFNTARKQTLHISLSFGIACFDPGTPCSIIELLAQADSMMFGNKRQKKMSDRI